MQRAFAVAASQLDHRSQAQKFFPALALYIQAAYLRLRDSQLSLRGVLVMSALVEFHQVHVKLDRVQHTLGGSLGQISECGVVLLDSVLIACKYVLR